MKTQWQILNDIAEERHGEFGFSTLTSDEQALYIDVKAFDKIADDEYAEFGFRTLSEDEQEEIINKYPEHILPLA